MTARRKQDAVLRVLRGEPLETVARENGVTVADLSGWRDRFLDGGAASLKSRPRDDRDDRIAQLQAKLGEITMDNELLYEKIARMEAGRPRTRGGCPQEDRHETRRRLERGPVPRAFRARPGSPTKIQKPG